MTQRRLPAHLQNGLYVLTGLPFLMAGWAKAAHPTLFLDHLLYREPWVPRTLAQLLSPSLAYVEIAIGCLLVSVCWTSFARKAAAGLLLAFVVFLSLSLVLEAPTPCSCYGQLMTLHPIVSILLNLILLGLLFLLERFPQNTSYHPRVLVSAILMICLSILGKNTASFDRFLVSIRPGMQIPVLPSLDPRAVNQDQPRLVLITRTVISGDRVQELVRNFPNHQLVVLVPRNLAFTHLADSSVIFLEMKPDLESLYVKTMPTSFALEKNTITKVWFGSLPPTSNP